MESDFEKVSGLEDASLAKPEKDFVPPVKLESGSVEKAGVEQTITPEEVENFKGKINTCTNRDELANEVRVFADTNNDSVLKIKATKIAMGGELPESIFPEGKDIYGIYDKYVELADLVLTSEDKEKPMHLSPEQEEELSKILETCSAEDMASEIENLGDRFGNQKLMAQAEFIRSGNIAKLYVRPCDINAKYRDLNGIND